MTTTLAMHRLLDCLVAGLAACQRTDPAQARHGALYCPYHDCFHTRCAEAAWPMVFAGSHHRDAALVENGLELLDWLIDLQNPDGSWHETPDDWKGTTVFQLMALAATLLQVTPSEVSEARARAYRQALGRACDWVCREISPRRVTTNYLAGGAAALALACKALPENPRWLKTARRLARTAAGRINAEGLIRGEGWGRRWLGIFRRPSNAIDIGYGLEMTLTALVVYASVLPGGRRPPDILPAIRAHLDFIYPDGSLDASPGSRGYKWTLFGSKTAHGPHAALAYAAQTEPRAEEALLQSTAFLEGCLQDGLLTDGPHAEARQGPACLYATVMRSCSLALALAFIAPGSDAGPGGAQPSRRTAPRVAVYRSLNTMIVSHPPWKATVCGYGQKLPCGQGRPAEFHYVPGGGSVTYLFHQGWGALQAATQLRHLPVEPLHIPPAADPQESLTPRLVVHTARGTATSAHWRKPHLAQRQDGGRTIVQVRSGLLLPGGEDIRLADGLDIEYAWDQAIFVKTYTLRVLETGHGPIELIEPVLLPDGAGCAASAQGLRIDLPARTLKVTADPLAGPWRLAAEIEPRRTPLPALRAVRLVCRLDAPQPGTWRIAVQWRVTGEGLDACLGENACRD